MTSLSNTINTYISKHISETQHHSPDRPCGICDREIGSPGTCSHSPLVLLCYPGSIMTKHTHMHTHTQSKTGMTSHHTILIWMYLDSSTVISQKFLSDLPEYFRHNTCGSNLWKYSSRHWCGWIYHTTVCYGLRTPPSCVWAACHCWT